MNGPRLIAAAALAALTLAACGDDNVLTEGTVVDREFDDEDRYMVTICTSYGKYGCNAWVPMWQTDPADWVLVIEGEHDGETVTERHSVDQATYDANPPGNYVELGES